MTNDNIRLQTTYWLNDKKKLKKIRRIVFIEEQQVPEELEWDEFDETSVHFLTTQKNIAIACARLKPDGQIGRMAVLPEYRNQGVGSQLLQYVLQQAKQLKHKAIYLNAQLSAVAFYEKHGFTGKGEIFYEANIAHREMLKKW